MTLDQALAEVETRRSGRTRYEGQPDYLDEVLADEVFKLRGLVAEWEVKAERRQRRIVLWKLRYEEVIGMLDRDKARELRKKFERQDEQFAKQFEEKPTP